VRSTWRVACVRIPRFPIGAVWRHAIAEGNGSLLLAQSSALGAQREVHTALQSPESRVQRNGASNAATGDRQLVFPLATNPGAPSSPASAGAPSRSLGATPSSSVADAGGDDRATPPSRFWDQLPLALVEGSRLRAVTAAAARSRLRAGMTTAEAQARCATVVLLPWDDVVVADAVRRATAAFLAASPQVTPVAGVPGLWWVGAGGFGSLGGEPALARSLRRLAAAWHPGARVAIADSCVAARAATWQQTSSELRGQRSEEYPAASSELRPLSSELAVVIVPPGGCAAYLADAPLGLVPMDEELRETLAALGIRTAGAFAALTIEDVERRWGADGLAASRLARGEDPRRPGTGRTDAPRAVSVELTPSVTTTEPVLFLVRAALDRLVRELIADGRAAATLSITLALDDARGGLPNALPHTITREVRPARPLARVLPLLERCRALLDRWTLSAPVCGLTVAVTATAPLTGEQGDLLDPAWRDPAAADAAFARLRAELGPDTVVFPMARDEHRPERAGGWMEVDESELGARSSAIRGTSPPDSSPTSELRALSCSFRHLETPEAIEVECEDGAPRVLWWRGRRIRVRRSVGPERLAGDWWKDGYLRDYWRCEEADDDGELVLFRDGSANGGWYIQGWYD
jgi:protein ImuB